MRVSYIIQLSNLIMFNLPQIEKEILDFWEQDKTFQKTLDKESPHGDYVFYDGPPFATGLPHYGHIVASLMKDIVPRYWTMKGYHVERKWGWDCHGLPIENIVEKELKLENKKDIEQLGIAKFNHTCQSKVLTYAEEWRKTIYRLGRWVDMDNDYKTMDLDFMESVWWVFKELWDKGLIYEGYKSMHICPRCETTLSQSEVSQGYKDIKDLSVIAKFELLNEPNTFILAWTTTPWTLPGNVALAVGEDIDYIEVEIESGNIPMHSFKVSDGHNLAETATKVGAESERYILAKANAKNILKDKKYKIIKKLKGKNLVGKKYKPLFPYYNNSQTKNINHGFKIYAADFVTVEDGTGVVHIAPAFGEDDMKLGQQYNLPFIQHVNMDGRFKDEVKDFKGLEVKPKDNTQQTDVAIIKYLAQHNLLFTKEKYEHSYPHCWRCDTPLLNYATSSLFVDVLKIKERALELAKEIDWTPQHIKSGRFGKWLEGARDWSISRQRFWGSVIPIWQCNKCQQRMVFGSKVKLEKISGQKINDLHKHVVDKIEFKCPTCGGVMHRVPDVLDCWFESGSMPYAQLHYPFDNKKKFEDNFPAEFIGEGVDQTRAWFYYLHILATALKNKPAFKHVIANGIVLAEDGKKMSKKLQNYPDPAVIFDKYGADRLRYYLAASPVMRAEDLNFNEKDLVEQTRFFNVLFNVLSFYQLFAEKIEVQAFQSEDSKHILDKWILARLQLLKRQITQKMDNYNLNVVREIPNFVNDLSTWYVRRSRDRFKSDDIHDKITALRTLHFVLLELSKVMAPFLPFTAEYLYRQLAVDNSFSVHLENWPLVDKEYINQSIIDYMHNTRKVVELGLAKRAEAGIKVRQPLNELKIKNCQLDQVYVDLIKDELNVKKIKQTKGTGELAVELDTKLTDELKQEGLFRELVRAINQQRKKMDLTIRDKVIIEYNTQDKNLQELFKKYKTGLKKSVLAERIQPTQRILKQLKVNDSIIGFNLIKKD